MREHLFLAKGGHAKVELDLLKDPLIVPVKKLKEHKVVGKAGFGVLDCLWHPTKPWVFTAGADGKIALYCES